MIWTSTSKFRPTLSIGIKSLLIKNVFQHENTLGKWLHFVPSGYILFPHPTGFLLGGHFIFPGLFHNSKMVFPDLFSTFHITRMDIKDLE